MTINPFDRIPTKIVDEKKLQDFISTLDLIPSIVSKIENDEIRASVDIVITTLINYIKDDILTRKDTTIIDNVIYIKNAIGNARHFIDVLKPLLPKEIIDNKLFGMAVKMIN